MNINRCLNRLAGDNALQSQTAAMALTAPVQSYKVSVISSFSSGMSDNGAVMQCNAYKLPALFQTAVDYKYTEGRWRRAWLHVIGCFCCRCCGFRLAMKKGRIKSAAAATTGLVIWMVGRRRRRQSRKGGKGTKSFTAAPAGCPGVNKA